MGVNKKNIAQASKFFFDEFVTHNHIYKTVGFFRRTPGGYLLMLNIMHHYFLDKDLHIEELLETVPNNIVSRLSLISYIDDATQEGILLKANSKSDKRKKTIKPTDKFIKEYLEWMTKLKT